MKTILDNIMPIVVTLLTAILSYIGVKIKNIIEKFTNEKLKKEIVCSTVRYIEQIFKNNLITSEEKYETCKNKALEWLNKKGLNVSDTELEILIESSVNCLKKEEDV